MNTDDVDGEMAAFHADGRRRKARVFAVAGLAIIICSLAFAAFVFFNRWRYDEQQRLEGREGPGFSFTELGLIIRSLATCGAGIGAIVQAVRLRAGTINDGMKDG